MFEKNILNYLNFSNKQNRKKSISENIDNKNEKIKLTKTFVKKDEPLILIWEVEDKIKWDNAINITSKILKNCKIKKLCTIEINGENILKEMNKPDYNSILEILKNKNTNEDVKYIDIIYKGKKRNSHMAIYINIESYIIGTRFFNINGLPKYGDDLYEWEIKVKEALKKILD